MTKTLSIDIGGSKVKAMVLDEAGQPITDRERMKTPQPATPPAILAAIKELAGKLGAYDRISVGFPAPFAMASLRRQTSIRSGSGFDWKKNFPRCSSAPRGWPTTPPCRATARSPAGRGAGDHAGHGPRLRDFPGRDFLPNLELAHHPFRHGKTYEELLGQKALERDGKKKWNKRLRKAIPQLFNLFYYDRLLLGGGNTEHLDFKLPESVYQIPNIAGIVGGVALWDVSAIGAVASAG